MTGPATDEARTAADAAWLCVYTKPQKEKYALAHLQRQEFHCFFPRIRRRIVRRGRKQWVTEPMFRRYLFIQVQPDRELTAVSSTRGVTRLVTFGGQPLPVPGAMIAAIRDRCEDEIYVQQEAEPGPGDSVDVVTGPYAGLQAVFLRRTNATERVRILLDIMQQQVELELDRDDITRTPDD